MLPHNITCPETFHHSVVPIPWKSLQGLHFRGCFELGGSGGHRGSWDGGKV
jgi:hypothetical protein